jgi:hypothetical protein
MFFCSFIAVLIAFLYCTFIEISKKYNKTTKNERALVFPVPLFCLNDKETPTKQQRKTTKHI